MSYFNIRVYGLLINQEQEILLSDEHESNRYFTKFPGGGLELGEGLIDALKREFMEECKTEIEVIEHVYTTDFYEKSSFNDSQIISIYYLVKPKEDLKITFKNKIFDFFEGEKQSFRWEKIENITTQSVTFKTDKVVVEIIKQKYKNEFSR